MSEPRKTFIDLSLNGEVLPEEIDDFIEEWHSSGSAGELHDFLGMSLEEYSLWVANPEFLSLILSARYRRQPVRQAVNDNYINSQRVAARAGSDTKLAQLMKWMQAQP